MINDNRMKHMLGVARKMYNMTEGDESLKRKMWLIGFLHDVGYEWDESLRHGIESANLINEVFGKNDISIYIRNHGTPAIVDDVQDLLNYCDMTVDYDGTPCTIGQRLANIEKRGKDTVYLKLMLRQNKFAEKEMEEYDKEQQENN